MVLRISARFALPLAWSVALTACSARVVLPSDDAGPTGANPCASIRCDTPPSVCYGPTGTCADGSCSYQFADGTACDDGDPCTLDDACVQGNCRGVPITCTAPPPPECTSSTSLRIAGDAGTCVLGTCNYTFGDTLCAHGCADAGCSLGPCADGQRDGTETDVDCGGSSCPACGANKACQVDADCAGHACVAGRCTPNCADGVMNNDETDVDCGGRLCSPCGLAKRCVVDPDCESEACDATSLTCVAGTCTDHRKDRNETDIDCGGGVCAACPTGKACKVDSDCTSNACDALSLTCVADPCADHRRDGNETDVDCGGTCAPCANLKRCTKNADCQSNACDTIALTCIADGCADGRQDGTETDVDCGGSCSPCGPGRHCGHDTDCTSSYCDPHSLTCSQDHCRDNQLDGDEADVDCGGSSCPPCAIGQQCKQDADCVAPYACDWGHAGPQVCISDPCADHHKDNGETDVDCGGTCPACGIGQACHVNTDCTSNACDANAPSVCVTDPCSDHQQDGNETDVDCGGKTTCKRCAAGQKCTITADCEVGHYCPAGGPSQCQ